MAGLVARNDTIDMKATTNTYSLLRAMTALPFAALLMSHALANPSKGNISMNSTPSPEPRRIFDAEKERFVPNPDYHAPVPARKAAPSATSAAEPRRIFNAESERFVSNPAYRPTTTTVKVVSRVGEPRRIYDAEKERFVPNPDYRGR